MTEIRLPMIDSDTEAGQLIQIRSYLYQLAEQLNLAFGRVEDEEKTANITYGSQAVSQSASSIEKAQAANTFNQVKGLIIKSADVVTALSEEISKKLNGLYVAQSEYGTFKETTEATLTATSKALEIEFSNNQEIDADSNGVKYAKLHTTDAWVKIGLIAEDTSPIYGIEIGQIDATQEDTNKRLAHFTADGIKLYGDEKDAIATISESSIKISRAEIGREILLGGYTINVERNNGIVFKWIGGV